MGKLLKKKSVKQKKKIQAANNDNNLIATGVEKKNGLKKVFSFKGKDKKNNLPKKTNTIKNATNKKAKNFIEKIVQFLREVKIELKKVTWPTRKQTVGSTIVVIILVLIISLFLWVIDSILTHLIRFVLQ